MKKNAGVRVRVTQVMKDQLLALADADDRSISAYLARIIEGHLGNVGMSDAPAEEIGEAGYVYFIKCAGYYKIGRARNVDKRLSGMCLPEKPDIVATLLCADYGRVEMALHALLADKRSNGEWFVLDEQDVSAVKHLLLSRQEKNSEKVVQIRTG